MNTGFHPARPGRGPIGAAPPGAHARRRSRTLADAGFAVFLWLVLIGTAPLQEWVLNGSVGQGDLVNQLLYLALFVLLLTATGVPSRRQLFCVPATLVLLLAYCFLSVLWAVAPLISLRRVVHMSVAVWLAFRFVTDLGPDHVIRRLRVAMALLLLVNFLAVFFTPFGIHGELFGEESGVVGNWRGVIGHKNIAGAACGLTILLFLFDNRQVSRALSALVIAGSAVFLYFAQSRTSAAVLLLAIALGLAIRFYNASYRSALAVLLVVVAGFGLVLLPANTGYLADILNDPTALTGRGAIWPLLLEYAGEHPWTGAGFGSFWLIGDASPIWTLTAGWVAIFVPHGHNGFLDLLVTIGVPGLVLAVATLAIAPLLRLLLSQTIAAPRRALLLALMLFCLGHNLTESSLLSGAALVQVFLMLAIAIIGREADGSAGQRLRQRLRRLVRGRRTVPLR